MGHDRSSPGTEGEGQLQPQSQPPKHNPNLTLSPTLTWLVLPQSSIEDSFLLFKRVRQVPVGRQTITVFGRVCQKLARRGLRGAKSTIYDCLVKDIVSK